MLVSVVPALEVSDTMVGNVDDAVLMDSLALVEELTEVASVLDMLDPSVPETIDEISI